MIRIDLPFPAFRSLQCLKYILCPTIKSFIIPWQILYYHGSLSCQVRIHRFGSFGEMDRGPAMPHILAALAIGFFSFLPCLAYADLTGQVIHVADGDTLTLVINKEWVRARLAGIDAPEANQPFGKLSRESLSDLCFWQQVTVIPKGKDQYGRMFAQVLCGDVDAGAEQVRRDMAWVYDRYAKDSDLKPLQAEAKAAKRGLWADPYSKPPWKWREVWQE